MKVLRALALFSAIFFSQEVFSQKIVYSEPDKDDIRRMNFEIIGKVSGNFLIYKSLRADNYIAVYDNDMKMIAREEHNYLPDERLINVDFFPYADHSYMVYQYQKRNVVYCQAVKIDGMGRRASEVIHLDTTHISFTANNRIYSVVSSEDKSHLMVFKVNSRDRSKYIITTNLFDDQLNHKKRARFVINMDENRDYLDEFNVDNDGDFVFTRFNRTSNESIESAQIIWKPATADSIIVVDVPHEKIWLDEPHLKVDNVNKRYFLTSFYYKERRGNIDGFFFYVWDKGSRAPAMQNSISLGEELRKEARNGNNLRMAFNDYFVRNVIVKRDGGFIINSEAYYTTSRFNSWNRWGYLYGPNNRYDYLSMSPMYNSWFWRNRFTGPGGQPVRHHADNITVLSFDKEGKIEWSNVIHKEQYDDESDDRISYQVMNTGSQIHYLFNMDEKRALLLNDYTLTPDGQMNRNPTLKNLDRGYEFLPKYAKQVSARQMIMPCFHRNYICFAKIEYN
ncbi:MAG TPA: hypothetical protein VGB46_09070 [Flavisolibacter sp.]|jgi:hypothetical protein